MEIKYDKADPKRQTERVSAVILTPKNQGQEQPIKKISEQAEFKVKVRRGKEQKKYLTKFKQ